MKGFIQSALAIAGLSHASFVYAGEKVISSHEVGSYRLATDQAVSADLKTLGTGDFRSAMAEGSHDVAVEKTPSQIKYEQLAALLNLIATKFNNDMSRADQRTSRKPMDSRDLPESCKQKAWLTRLATVSRLTGTSEWSEDLQTILNANLPAEAQSLQKLLDKERTEAIGGFDPSGMVVSARDYGDEKTDQEIRSQKSADQARKETYKEKIDKRVAYIKTQKLADNAVASANFLRLQAIPPGKVIEIPECGLRMAYSINEKGKYVFEEEQRFTTTSNFQPFWADRKQTAHVNVVRAILNPANGSHDSMTSISAGASRFFFDGAK